MGIGSQEACVFLGPARRVRNSTAYRPDRPRLESVPLHRRSVSLVFGSLRLAFTGMHPKWLSRVGVLVLLRLRIFLLPWAIRDPWLHPHLSQCTNRRARIRALPELRQCNRVGRCAFRTFSCTWRCQGAGSKHAHSASRGIRSRRHGDSLGRCRTRSQVFGAKRQVLVEVAVGVCSVHEGGRAWLSLAFGLPPPAVANGQTLDGAHYTPAPQPARSNPRRDACFGFERAQAFPPRQRAPGRKKVRTWRRRLRTATGWNCKKYKSQRRKMQLSRKIQVTMKSNVSRTNSILSAAESMVMMSMIGFRLTVN